MTEEEKEAIRKCKKAIKLDKLIRANDDKALFRNTLQLLLNLIKKQEKIIDEMADNIFNIIDYGTFIDDIEDLENETKVKQYFYRKAEEDG